MKRSIQNIPVMGFECKCAEIPEVSVAGGQSNVVIASIPVPAGAGLIEAVVYGYDATAKECAVYKASIAAKNLPARAAVAVGTLTSSGAFTNAQTVTIGTKVYTFQTTLTNVDGNVLIGASQTESHANLMNAINLGAGAGTTYAAAMTLHPTVTATAATGTTTVLASKATGTLSNAIATTETQTNAAFGAGTLTGGLDPVVAVGSVSAVFTAEDDSGWAATLAVNGPEGTVEVKVTADGTNATIFSGGLVAYPLG